MQEINDDNIQPGHSCFYDLSSSNDEERKSFQIITIDKSISHKTIHLQNSRQIFTKHVRLSVRITLVVYVHIDI